MKAFLRITNSRNRESNHYTSRQSTREYGAEYLELTVLIVYRLRCHCCKYIYTVAHHYNELRYNEDPVIKKNI